MGAAQRRIHRQEGREKMQRAGASADASACRNWTAAVAAATGAAPVPAAASGESAAGAAVAAAMKAQAAVEEAGDFDENVFVADVIPTL